MNEKFLIAIDLGTSNSALAYTELEAENPEIHRFPITQVLEPGSEGEHKLLPSFFYQPTSEEKAQKTLGVSWDSDRSYVVGRAAKQRGDEVPERAITSAKSWLCHEGMNRNEAFLPVGQEKEELRKSPVEVTAAFLQHIREAWNQNFLEDQLEEQVVIITVPASFAPGARQLTLEAAEQAGYPEVILLEEPQAAFYAWLYQHRDDWRDQLAVGDKVLVFDIGGGTSDFSLISVKDEGGDLSLEREAVGSHLLLGGDNFDLALAHFLKKRFEEQGNQLDNWQFQQLVSAGRDAKEKLLSRNDGDDQHTVSILGRGSSLIGGTLSVQVNRSEVAAFLVDGFFPKVNPEDQSPPEKHLGLQQLGLPYAQDPRITCQMAKFLSRTGENSQASTDHFVQPSAVLFNGGTMKAGGFQKRVEEVLNFWSQKLGKKEVKVLEAQDLDGAVSLGAVYYGLARRGKAVRIKGGINRSYFIGVEESIPAIPGMEPPLQAFCLAPFGMEEGSEVELSGQEFALLLGEKATFRFFSRSTGSLADGSEIEAGTVLKTWKEDLTELHAVEARLDRGAEDGKTVRVNLKAQVTELGVLELWCVAADGRKWKLEFDVRHDNEAGEPAIASG